MSQRSAVWSALALAVVFVLLFGAVLLRPALGDSADAQEPARTIVIDGPGSGDDAGAPSSDSLSGDDDDWYEDDEHDDDDHDEDEYDGEDEDDD